jgi:hypothetical protein
MGASLLSLVGCGETDLSDEYYGTIDLGPYFYDGSSASDPYKGLPRNLTPQKGWNSGLRAEYYDFGLVNHVKKRSAAGATLKEPDYAYVNPMYFFFDAGGKPLFSKPIYDGRTGIWHMRGGKDVLNPNPNGAPSGGTGRNSYYAVPYSVRVRSTVKDRDRGNVDDYQRPIIDTLHNDSRYTGLWEIVEIKVQDSAYEPDAIKSAKTLKEGIESGKLIERKTTKVIDCPVLDDRTYVTPSAMAYDIPRPRIEVWYRTKLGSCYLIHGFEALGEVRPEDGNATPSRNPANIVLFRAGSGDRVDTFDVIRYSIGDSRNQVTTVVVPVMKLYTPKVTISTLNPSKDKYDLRYFGDDLSAARPRHFPWDAPGYSPIVWHWDVEVRQDPPYVPGTFKTLESVDPALVKARDAGDPVWTRNYPVLGAAIPCGTRFEGGKAVEDVEDRICAPLGLKCNLTPDIDVATTDPPPGKNIVDMLLDREGGPRCDVPTAAYGMYCAPGVARCETNLPAASKNETLLKAVGIPSANPTFTSFAAIKTAETTLMTRKADLDKAQMALAAMPADMMLMTAVTTAMTAVTSAQTALDNANRKADGYRARGYWKDLGGLGYECHPVTGGFCYVRCDNSVGASAGKVSKDDLMVMDPATKKPKPTKYDFETDARCGAASMLGYKCQGATAWAEKRRVCTRACNSRDPDSKNLAVCNYRINDRDPASPDPKLGALQWHEDLAPMTEMNGQECYAGNSLTACAWNPDFEPRNPDVFPGRQ